MLDIKSKIGTVTPYIVCGLQELERMNGILAEMARALAELALGLAGCAAARTSNPDGCRMHAHPWNPMAFGIRR
eukprot:5404374-Prymnesium_polylepis.2